MAFFNSAIEVLQTLVVALGAGLGVWGAINLMEGYGNDNPGAKAQGIIPKHSTNTIRSDTTLRKCFIVFSPSLKMRLLPPQRRREPVVMQRTGRTAEERG